MKPTEAPDPVARRAREVFAAASDHVDPATAGRLRLARRAALAAGSPPRAWLMPIAGAVAAALVAWLAWPHAQAPAPVPAPVATSPAVPEPAPVSVPDVPAALPAHPLVEAPIDEPLEDDVPIDDDAAWAALDDEDAELYAWLADAPVAPDDGGDAL
jgi:hypothetical protein